MASWRREAPGRGGRSADYMDQRWLPEASKEMTQLIGREGSIPLPLGRDQPCVLLEEASLGFYGEDPTNQKGRVAGTALKRRSGDLGRAHARVPNEKGFHTKGASVRKRRSGDL